MLAERFDTFLFDLDGVIYISRELLPGVEETMARLRARGKTIRFLTNDPQPTRKALAATLSRLGVEADASEIITSGSATAAYAREEGIVSVYVVGSDGLREEMQAAGLSVTTEEAEAVIIGCALSVGYPEIAEAARHIWQGARFIATNEDPSFPTENGRAPGTGAIVSAVQTSTGIAPEVVGKPHPAMFDAALKDVDRERAVMIGDSLGSDIAGAHGAGITSVLVAEEPLATDHPATPDIILSSLKEFFAPASPPTM